MRSIGLDIHRDFCEVAIAERVRSARPRIEMTPAALELFAGSLGHDDRVALEVSGNAWEVVRIMKPHVARVVVVSPADTGIRSARAKTDRLDARALAKLLASGSLDAVWVPDEATRAMRRRLQRRSQLVRVKTKAKNEIHAALMRRLIARPRFSDLFGLRGRRWLAEVELPAEERETVDGCLRQLEFCETEIAQIERVIAAEALRSPEVRRLMTVPGVNVITAATFMAAIGDIRRFADRKKLVGYLGLDPRVRQSGASPTSRARISKQGSASARYALVEASWSVVRAPGPIRAFYERIRARRGHRRRSFRLAQARLPVLVPAHPLRGLRLCAALADAQEAASAGAHRRRPAGQGEARHLGSEQGDALRRARAGLPAEVAYRRTVADWQRAQKKKGAGATPGRASNGPSSGQAARQDQAPEPAL